MKDSDNSVVERIAPGGQASDVDVPSQTPGVAQLVPGSGTETSLAKAHQYEGYNSFMALQPTMAADGAVWQLVDVATLEPSDGQDYFEVTPECSGKKRRRIPGRAS